MFESYDNVYNFWFENGASSVTFLEYDDGLTAFDSSLYPRKFEDMVKIVEERTSKKLKKVFSLIFTLTTLLELFLANANLICI